MVLLLSLCAAVAYGLSDFVGGVVTRRTSVWAVAAASQATAALLAIGLVATNPGNPTFDAWGWACSGIATICFQLAAQRGLLTIAGVVTSLYPAVTVLLAAAVFRERIHQTQRAGLALATVAVVLIASG